MSNIPPPNTGLPGVGAGIGVPTGIPTLSAGLSTPPLGAGLNSSGGPPGLGAGLRTSGGPPGLNTTLGAPPAFAQTMRPGGAPLRPGKKSLKGSSNIPSSRPLQSGSIDLPLVAPTGPQSYTRNQNRQTPPPLPIPSISISPIPTIPTSSSVITVVPGNPKALTNAIESAHDGTEIRVQAGDYPESIKINKNLYFIANGKVNILSDTHIDNVTCEATLCTFKGFNFIQSESQSSGAAMVNSGKCLFEDCSFSSHYMPTITTKGDSNLYLRNCRVECTDAAGLDCRETSTTYCDSTTFKAPKNHGVMVRNEAVTKFVNCSASQCARNSFVFMNSSKFIFENATIDKPFEIQTQSKCAVVSNCKVNGTYLKVSGSGTPYISQCTFNGCGVECLGVSGVTLQSNLFVENRDTPAILVYGDSTVESHDDTIKSCHAGAAVAVYMNGELKLNNFKGYDLAGVGFLSYGNCQLDLIHCAIVNASNGGIVCHSGSSLSLTETIIEKVGNVGVLLSKSLKAVLKKSKIARCSMSGIELNTTTDVEIDHCIFEENGQCGLVGIESSINVNDSDFINNKYAGVDLRNSKFTITKSISCSNVYGGFALRNNSSGTLHDVGIGDNQQFGVCVDTGSNVTVKGSKIMANDGLACYSSSGGILSVIDCNVSHHEGIALESDGSDSKLSVIKSEIVQNGTAIQVNEGAVCEITETKLFDNGAHIEVSPSSKVTAKDDSLQQSRNGIGIMVAQNGTISIDNCKIIDEAKTAIANEGNATITGSNIEDCGTCGIFWFGNATGEIKNNEILRNGSCGIQVMKGKCSIIGNTIQSHSAFGIHADKEAEITNEDNKFSQNSISDVNNEAEKAQE